MFITPYYVDVDMDHGRVCVNMGHAHPIKSGTQYVTCAHTSEISKHQLQDSQTQMRIIQTRIWSSNLGRRDWQDATVLHLADRSKLLDFISDTPPLIPNGVVIRKFAPCTPERRVAVAFD